MHHLSAHLATSSQPALDLIAATPTTSPVAEAATTPHLAAAAGGGGVLEPSGLYDLIAGHWVKVVLVVIGLMVFGKAMKGDASKVATIVGLSLIGLAMVAVSANPGAAQNLGKSAASLIGLGG